MLECKQEEKNLPNGFVRFRPVKSTTVTVPEHLRASMPDPLQTFQKKTAPTPETKRDKSSEELQQDLDRINQQKEQRMKALLVKRKERQMGTKSSSLSALPPPPEITFGSRKRQRQK